ncbi:hypothetical protein [Halorussus litoreus]|uniref:hypothetical protein n=1 Tax=Halorussus litoreus TaxID=1710536 RepID=UPI000E242000|nr:hypothetical protein [Halorussus litoreus]
MSKRIKDMPDGEEMVDEHLNELWNEEEPEPSDKEKILEFFRENDSRPYKQGIVESRVLGIAQITIDDFNDMPESIPSLPDHVEESLDEEKREKYMITEMAEFQANRARVRNLLEDLVYEGKLEKRELPQTGIYGGLLDKMNASVDSSDEIDEVETENQQTETFYKYSGEAE